MSLRRKNTLRFFGPHIKLDLGEGSSIHDVGEPPVEVAGMVPTVEVEEESSVEVIEGKIPVGKKSGDMAVHGGEGIGVEPVLEAVKWEQMLSLFLWMSRWEQVLSLF